MADDGLITAYWTYGDSYCAECLRAYLAEHPDLTANSTQVDQHGVPCVPYPKCGELSTHPYPDVRERPIEPQYDERVCHRCGKIGFPRPDGEVEFVESLLGATASRDAREIVTRLSSTAPLALLLVKAQRGLHPDLVEFGRLMTVGVHQISSALFFDSDLRALENCAKRKDPLVLWDVITFVAFGLYLFHTDLVRRWMRPSRDVEGWLDSSAELYRQLYPPSSRSSKQNKDLVRTWEEVVSNKSRRSPLGSLDTLGLQLSNSTDFLCTCTWMHQHLADRSVPLDEYYARLFDESSETIWKGIMKSSKLRDRATFTEKIRRFFGG